MTLSRPSLIAYQGTSNQWEADEGGHLNVRYHLQRAFVGLAGLAAHMAMPRAFGPGANATILPLELHARYLKEARPGALLTMRAGVLELGETDGRFVFDMRHENDAPSAAFTMKAVHVEPRTLKTFPWSSRTRAAAEALLCAAPEHSLARSIDLDRPPPEANIARADAVDALRTGMSVILPDECDAFGRMRPELVFGRCSDAAGHVFAPMRRVVGEALGVTLAGAVVEARIRFRRWPECGDLVAVRSGVVATQGKVMRIMHWLLNPINGKCWASVEACSLAFDIATRKSMSLEGTPHAMITAVLKPEMDG